VLTESSHTAEASHVTLPLVAPSPSAIAEEDGVHYVYACPVCNAPFRRWRNAIRHFKACCCVRSPLSSAALSSVSQSTLHWEVPEKGQRAAQRMRRKSKVKESLTALGPMRKTDER